MVVALLGIIDIFAAGALIAYGLGHPFPHAQAGLALGLIMKGLIFVGDILSLLDIAIGITMFVLFWMQLPTLALAMAAWLLYKGLYAWF